MKINGSHLVALAILAGIGGWIFTGTLIQGGQVNPDAKTIAEREASRATEAFRVRVTNLQPSQRQERLEIRGRTQASATVSVRAETGGTVEQRPVSKGQMV
ncbi:MAG: efflux RND transporter periplasmic adaptor subunit, partial [Pseudomonadota bacterium]